MIALLKCTLVNSPPAFAVSCFPDSVNFCVILPAK
jgi:hypothetical protein